MKNNLLLSTDVYKMGHMEQYAPGTSKVYSYLCARKPGHNIVNFGLQYYLKEYLVKPIYTNSLLEFIDIYESILGKIPQSTIDKLWSLFELGYLPLKIKQVPEGTIVPSGNIIMSVTNTHYEYAWVVGFFESLLLKVWNTCTVATYSNKLKRLVNHYADISCDNSEHIPFSVHDFGYRGVSSEETALLSGMAHLVNFYGTDTILGVYGAKKYYNAIDPVGLSVPASEHSVMCSFGPENEYSAFEHMLNTYPTGIVSIVSDTYNLWKVLTDYTSRLRDRILMRDGKVVFRPDSGDQEKIICGDPDGSTPEEKKGALQLLADTFGYYLNEKGFRVLNPKVGLIYGDGFYFDKFDKVLSRMTKDGWATSNLVVGIGGLLLQNHSRDEFGFSMKATYIERNGKPENIYKDPITDPGKKSHCGLMRLDRMYSHGGFYYKTSDKQDWKNENGGLLEEVFCNGKITKEITFEEVRNNVNSL